MNVEVPLISVIMGVFYRSPDTAALERSVTSILKQTYENLEFLICDDGSSEEAVSLLDQKATEDHRTILVRPGTAFALPRKLNFCLQTARGSLIARMDDDDFSHPERLAQQLKFLNRHPETAFVGCNAALIRDGTVTGQRLLPEFPTVQDFYMVQPYIHPTLLFRREALDAVGGYSEEKHCLLCEDYDLLLRSYAAGYTGANLQQVLFDYTVPATAKGNRRMNHRWNETATRYRRFRQLGLLPGAWPYVVKPLAVGALPEPVLRMIKMRCRQPKEDVASCAKDRF